MALVVYDRVKETTTTTGTGSVTLAGAATGYQSFAVVGNGNTTYYCIASQTATEWEVGIGTYSTTGPSLARTTVLASSNAGNVVNFSAGTKDVFVTNPAGKFVTNAGDFATGTWPISVTGNAANVTGTVAVANGGSGQTTAQAAMNAFAGATTSGSYLRGNGTNVVMSTIQAADVPTLNQSTTGTAANVTGTVAIANGGSGQTTAQLAMNAFAGATTSGSYLRGNGTNVVMSTIQAADVPTLNQNTTGTASNVTGTVAVANGGTGLTAAPTNGQIDIGNGTGFTRTTLTQGSGVTITNSAGGITIAATGSGGTVTSVGGTGTVNGITLSGTVTSSGNLTLGGTLSGVSLTTQVTGTLPVANGGTGATSFNNNYVLLGKGTSAVTTAYITTDGSTYYEAGNPTGSGAGEWRIRAYTFGSSTLTMLPNSGGSANINVAGVYDLNLQRTGTTYATLNSSGITLASGKNLGLGGTTPTTSGTGITFPATVSNSTNANTLDDYETGSYTPTYYGGTTAGTTTYGPYGYGGRYVKIGRLVMVSGYVSPSSASGTGDIRLGGLPFTIYTQIGPPAYVGAVIVKGVGTSNAVQSIGVVGSAGGSDLLIYYTYGTTGTLAYHQMVSAPTIYYTLCYYSN